MIKLGQVVLIGASIIILGRFIYLDIDQNNATITEHIQAEVIEGYRLIKERLIEWLEKPTDHG